MIDMTRLEIETLLSKTLIGRLAMSGDDQQPYVIPMPFCWFNNLLYLRLPQSGRKGKILAENNKVCFEVDWYTESLSDYASILIEGYIEWVDDFDERKTVNDANTRKYLELRGGIRPGHGRNTELIKLPLQKIIPRIVCGKKKNIQGNLKETQFTAARSPSHAKI